MDQYKCYETLTDIEKALNYLDCGETSEYNLEFAIQTAIESGLTKVACKYFTVVFYKKGTCHIQFHNQKIVDRLNIFVGRKRAWLPPSYGKSQYRDMDAESKRVVDEFMGREHYEKVMRQPANYVIEGSSIPLLM